MVQHAQSKATHYTKVGICVPFPHSTRIFTERHIQLPVKTFFYSPMTANGIRKTLTKDISSQNEHGDTAL